MKIVWSPLALDQVAEAFASIGAERPFSAQEWLEELIDKASSLALFPEMGRMVPEAERPALRELLVGNHRLIYRRDEAEVVILAVHHVRRDLRSRELGPSVEGA